MDRLINMMDARIYVSTDYVYNSGNFFGQWMQLCDYKNKQEFRSAFCSLYPSEKEPVLLILYWQDVPKPLICINDISSKIFKLMNLLSGFDSYRNKAFHLWIDRFSPEIFNCKSREIIRLFENSYQGYYEETELFGRYYAKECLAITNPDFDYALFGVQLLEEQFIQIEGYVFKRITIN
ncbi:antirestriction protein ArdA [Dysgonomonas termitidis]|uniref:Antirestriction protein ArdA n=1 Tax=Dysgonomonas termitidis TaxID=1516126 RepID=A0ABV9L3M4_9BACT